MVHSSPSLPLTKKLGYQSVLAAQNKDQKKMCRFLYFSILAKPWLSEVASILKDLLDPVGKPRLRIMKLSVCKPR